MVARMNEYIHQSHNVSIRMYHLVGPAKYRRVVFDASVDSVLKEVCLEIAKRYAILVLEIGTDKEGCI
jgi:REP-associated tyrosine transposase